MAAPRSFADVVRQTRLRAPGTSIELLIPDFKGSEQALRIVVDAKPRHSQPQPRNRATPVPHRGPGGRYDRALELLARVKQMDARMLSKSGIMVGLGEQWDELQDAIRHLRHVGCDILTLGQYLRPSATHMPVARYYTPDEFGELKDFAQSLGFRHVEAGPLVRSSYHAWEQAERAGATTAAAP